MPDNQINYYYGSILDPIHGDIKLSEIEKWIISHPIFARLRRVKQNTFLYYVFPSANHTRFEHSIGVMHMATRIYRACKENYNSGTKKSKQTDNQNHPFFNLNNLKIERESAFFQELRLAALLHDIGHGPMSHLFDSFTISKEAFLDIVRNEPILKDYEIGFTNLIDKNEGKVEHEIVSCFFVFVLIDKLKRTELEEPNFFPDETLAMINDIKAQRIVKMIEPEFSGLPDLIDDNQTNYTQFFSEIITGFPIDADRMDYLLRDSYFSGVTYGIYDVNRILSSFMPIIDDGKVKLAYKESGSDAMLRFIQSRSHLYNQVYFHKTNRGANLMLNHATLSLKNTGVKLLTECKTADELIDFYVKNGDEVFLNNTIKDHINKENVQAREIITDLINRKLFKRIFRKRITINAEDKKTDSENYKNIKKIVAKISEKLFELNKNPQEPYLQIYSAVDISENEIFKDSDNDKTVGLVKKMNKNYIYVPDWLSHSLEFKSLDIITISVRIYIKRSFQNLNEYESFSLFVLNYLSEEISALEAIN